MSSTARATGSTKHGAPARRYPTLAVRPKVLERDVLSVSRLPFFRAFSLPALWAGPDVDPSFDYDLWIRMTQRELRFAFIPDYLANSRLHAERSRFAGARRSFTLPWAF